MNEIHNPKRTTLELAELSGGNVVTSRDAEYERQQKQMHHLFDELAEKLEDYAWRNDEIEEVIVAVYYGSGMVFERALAKLREVTYHIELRPAEQELWTRWTTSDHMNQLVSSYDNRDRHSAHQLRMQLVNLVSRIAKATY